jgi:hypothetical protein
LTGISRRDGVNHTALSSSRGPRTDRQTAHGPRGFPLWIRRSAWRGNSTWDTRARPCPIRAIEFIPPIRLRSCRDWSFGQSGAAHASAKREGLSGECGDRPGF